MIAIQAWACPRLIVLRRMETSNETSDSAGHLWSALRIDRSRRPNRHRETGNLARAQRRRPAGPSRSVVIVDREVHLGNQPEWQDERNGD